MKTMILPRGSMVHFDGIPLWISADVVVEGNKANWHLDGDQIITGTAWRHTEFEPDSVQPELAQSEEK